MTERGKKTSDARYHAVSIVLPSNVCEAAKALIDKRFLAAEAPIFPVDGCDEASCSCGYRHFGDRRDGPRRALDIGFAKEIHAGDVRRVSPDRRDEGQPDDGDLEGEAVDYFIYVDTRQ